MICNDLKFFECIEHACPVNFEFIHSNDFALILWFVPFQHEFQFLIVFCICVLNRESNFVYFTEVGFPFLISVINIAKSLFIAVLNYFIISSIIFWIN